MGTFRSRVMHPLVKSFWHVVSLQKTNGDHLKDDPRFAAMGRLASSTMSPGARLVVAGGSPGVCLNIWGIGATYPNAFGAPVHFPLWIASPHGCVYLRLAPNHCSNRALGQRLKLAVFGRLRQLRLLLMAAARDIRLKPKVCSPH